MPIPDYGTYARASAKSNCSIDTQSDCDQLVSVFQAAFTADFLTGAVFWKASRSGVSAGKEAGTINVFDGYRKVQLHKRIYSAHRIIWTLYHGTSPCFIDHINGVRDDNRIVNLRDVSFDENLKNKVKYKNNASGHTGVYWVKADNIWRAEIKVNGKQINLGRFKNLQDAILARAKAESSLGFHENHGLSPEDREKSGTPVRASAHNPRSFSPLAVRLDGAA